VWAKIFERERQLVRNGTCGDSVSSVPANLALRILAGLLGVAYNRSILGVLAAAKRFQRRPVELRAALIGARVGVLAWFALGVVGGGDPITQRTLDGTEALLTVLVVFLPRFVLGPASYAAGTPGGCLHLCWSWGP
jgi:CIC family chloride channel protein